MVITERTPEIAVQPARAGGLPARPDHSLVADLDDLDIESIFSANPWLPRISSLRVELEALERDLANLDVPPSITSLEGATKTLYPHHMDQTVTSHIESTPGICGGKPRIRGHRIRVQDIVTWHEAAGLSPEEIVARFPQINLGDVYAALAYFHDHREEIRSSMAQGDSLITSLKAHIRSKANISARMNAPDDDET